MIYIFLSVCCSVFVSVLLKLAKRYEIDTRQAIAWNYITAALMNWVIFSPVLPVIGSGTFPVYLALGFLLPTLFLVLSYSVRFTGIVRTDIAQRLSLFIPVLAAFLFFGETASPAKILGIGIAFVAIFLSIPWQKNSPELKDTWIYPLLVFFGMGVIDILFKQIAANQFVPFPAALQLVFILAFVLSMSYLIFLRFTGKLAFSLINFICGIILGISNFGNILFYLKAHQALSNDPSLVFSAMNIGVIIMGTAVGVFIFKERLSTLNYVGVALALISIITLVFLS